MTRSQRIALARYGYNAAVRLRLRLERSGLVPKLEYWPTEPVWDSTAERWTLYPATVANVSEFTFTPGNHGLPCA